MQISRGQQAALAILLEAEQAGSTRLVRTTLFKLLYLLDVFVAEETSGQTWTGAEWIFLHFGPFSPALARELDVLVEDDLIEREDVAADKEYVLYHLAYARPQSLHALGVSTKAQMRLSQTIHQFGSDLNKLLNFVYFETEPMRNAVPGEVLSFSGCRAINYQSDIRPIPIPLNDATKKARIRELLKTIAEEYRNSQGALGLSPAPSYDDHFLEAVRSSDAGDRATIEARLLFPTEDE